MKVTFSSLTKGTDYRPSDISEVISHAPPMTFWFSVHLAAFSTSVPS